MFPFSSFFNNDNKSEEEVRKHYFHLMKSPDAYEKKAFISRIKELEVYLEESWELYYLTRESDYTLRSMILREIDSISVSLAMLKNKHRLWKAHRVTISK
jgi:hypothetical protein